MLKEDILIANRYLLKKLLGRGGFSEVWLAMDKMTSVEVALKIYAPGTGLDEEGMELFSQEFSLVFDLNHSNLLKPTYYDCFERRPFLVLPFCERGSSFKLVGNMSESEAWKFLKDVSDGLNFLHNRVPPVIHQDIKPDNILVDKMGRYMITDFGISTRARSTLRKSVNNDVSSAGTWSYMGPERFSRNPAPIMASDIYSLGVTIFELLTGDTPFGRHGGMVQKEGAEIPELQGDYSNSLKKLINKCLSKETWERPTAAQINEYAQQALDNKPIIFAKEERKKGVNKKAVYIGGGALGIILLFVFIFSFGGKKQDDTLIYSTYLEVVNQADSLRGLGEKQIGVYEEDLLKALDKYKEALSYEKDVSKKNPLLNVEKKIEQTGILLQNAYDDLIIRSEKMLSYEEYAAADAFMERAKSLKSKLTD